MDSALNMAETFVIGVKNTFLHLSLPPFAAPAGRRAASAPCVLRGAAVAAPACSAVEINTQADKEATSGAGPSEVSARWSDISTAADSPCGASCSWSCCADSEVECKSQVSGRSPEPEFVPVTAAVLAPLQPLLLQHRTPLNSRARPWQREEASAADSRRQQQAPQVQQQRQQQQQQQAGCLGSQAAALAPRPASFAAAGAGPRPAGPVPGAGKPGTGDFLRQLTTIVAAAAAALAGFSKVKLSGSSEGPRGWYIMASIRPEDAPRTQQILSCAKDALLQAAKESSSVYVLGHRAQPFVSTPVGFAASLGAIGDESKVCWSMVNDGFCRRGAACRWQHPVCQTNVNVIIKVDKAA